MEKRNKVVRKSRKFRCYEKMADCIIQHVKIFHKQSYHNERANFGEPCATCRHIYDCNHDWLSMMTPIFDISTVRFEMPNLPDRIKQDGKVQHDKQGIDDRDPVPHMDIPIS